MEVWGKSQKSVEVWGKSYAWKTSFSRNSCHLVLNHYYFPTEQWSTELIWRNSVRLSTRLEIKVRVKSFYWVDLWRLWWETRLHWKHIGLQQVYAQVTNTRPYLLSKLCRMGFAPCLQLRAWVARYFTDTKSLTASPSPYQRNSLTE